MESSIAHNGSTVTLSQEHTGGWSQECTGGLLWDEAIVVLLVEVDGVVVEDMEAL